MSKPLIGRLISDVIFEPLWSQWYAWSYLIPPISAARYLTESQIPIMESFIEAPQAHIDALRDPEMIGGPFMQYGVDRVDEVRELLEQTKKDQRHLIALSKAIAEAENILNEHPRGASLEPVYQHLPIALRGMVELVNDARDCPSIRFLERMFYRSDFYNTSNQSISLRRLPDVDRRPFVMSTPRLARDLDCQIPLQFTDPRIDALSRMRFKPGSVDEMAEQLELSEAQRQAFFKLFTESPLPPKSIIDDNDVHVSYLGHACAMVQTRDVTVLCDALIGYENPTGIDRISYMDLPDKIDYVVITHNHQDHVMFETLLQLRHRIGSVIVPRSQVGSLLDPSLRMTLEKIGFDDVIEIEELQSIDIPGGEIIGLPFLGEHGDLNIATKMAWLISVKGRSVICAADSNNIDNLLYEHIKHLFGSPDILFLGMESDGAPYSWSYGPLLPTKVPRDQAQSRRLDGSNAERGLRLVETLKPEQVYIYAMGMEPWLNYITSIHYTPDSGPILESNQLVETCRQRGITAERMLGCRTFRLTAKDKSETNYAAKTIAVPEDAYNLKPSEPLKKVKRKVQAKQADSAQTSVPEQSAGELTAFLKHLGEKEVRLWLEAGQLRCSAPKGALTKELTAKLKEHKPQIMNLLQSRLEKEGQDDSKQSLHDPLNRESWRDDMLLDETIVPGKANPENTEAKNILLTGASGFLGPYLLAELLQQTSARIHCLVRAKTDQEARSRIHEALRLCDCWQDEFSSRIVARAGDLDDKTLGLGDEGFKQLAGDIDLIVHNGARVHHAMPYEQLRQTNVMGTQTILRLACLDGHCTPLHHISTLSVLPAAASAEHSRYFEQDPVRKFPPPKGGYNLSKWVSENLIAEASKRGLPVSVYRPGPVSGDSRNGFFNSNDFLYRLMSGYVQSGLAPDGATQIDLLPVDFVARSIIAFSRQTESAGKTYHLLHPQSVSSELLFDVCSEAGFDIKRVPYEAWFKHLGDIARDDEKHALYPLAALFSSRKGRLGETDITELPFDTTQAEQAMQTAGLSVPKLDKALFATYLTALLKTLPNVKQGNSMQDAALAGES